MRTLLLIAGLLLAGSFAFPARAADAAAPFDILLQDGWMLPSTGDMAVAYVTVANQSRDPITIKSLTSPYAKMIEAHQTVVVGGVAQMRPITPLTIKPGEVHAFMPQSDHIMVMGLTHPLQPGQSFPLVLNLADGRAVTGSLSVRDPVQKVQ